MPAITTPESLRGARMYDPKRIYGQTGVDWEMRIDFDGLRKKRLDRIRQTMKARGLGALLYFQHYGIRYVTGTYGGMWQTFDKAFRYCLLPADGDPVIFEVPGVDLICQRSGAPWISDWRPAIIWRGSGAEKTMMAKKFAAEIKAVLKKHGVAEEKVGIDSVDFDGYQALVDAGIHLADGTTALWDAALLKFPEELELLKQACAIQDAAFHEVKQAIHPGLKEVELKGIITKTLYSLGAERIEQVTMASGGRTNPFWRSGSTDKIIRYGDMILIDICYQYGGYNTCYYRNFVCGKPNRGQKEAYRKTYDTIYAAINAIRPGVTTAQIARMWKDMGLGYTDDAYGSVSLLQFAHGLGITNHEPPFVTMAYSEEYPATYQKDMYIAVETYAETPDGREAARLEENFVVTDDGVQVFSLYPFEDELLDG